MCRRSVGVHGRVRIVQSNGFGIFFDGLLRARTRHARGERERERTAMMNPSSVDGSRCVFVNANWKARQRKRERKRERERERERDVTARKRMRANRIFVPLHTARSYTERSRLLCIAARSARRRMPYAFFFVFDNGVTHFRRQEKCSKSANTECKKMPLYYVSICECIQLHRG